MTNQSSHCQRARSFADNKRLPDPNAPKRGLSAYMFFANEQRDNVREENPGITFGKLAPLHSRSCRPAPF